MKNNMDESIKFYIECDCGCGILEFQLDNCDDNEELFISHHTLSFYARQQPGWMTFKDRLKLIWCAITGKEYYFFDIILNGKNLDEFRNQIKKLIKEN